MAQPKSDECSSVAMAKKPIEVVVAENLSKLRKKTGISQHRLAGSDMSQSTVGRILSAAVSAGIDNIESLSQRFDLQPWQLLVPNLDPDRPPRLADLSNAEWAVIDEYREHVAKAVANARKG